MSRLLLVPVLLLILYPHDCVAATYVVKPDGTGDFPTIQAAIDGATDGDIIELTNGVFSGHGNRDVDFLGKEVVVRSQSGDPDSCVVDCGGTSGEYHKAFIFISGETRLAGVEGLTILGGYSDLGGAVDIREYSGPTLTNCIFTDNTADYGGAVYCRSYSFPLILDCVFTFNEAFQRGGGLDCHCGAWPVVRQCTFYANKSPRGSSIGLRQEAAPYIPHSILMAGISGVPVYCEENSHANLNCCDVYGNEAGDWVGCIAGQEEVHDNFSLDPFFCDADNGDFTLARNSPCLPENSPCATRVGARDVGCEAVPHGACCFPDGSCQFLPDYLCAEAGGLYSGDDTDCDPNPCPSGACCFDDGHCEIWTADWCGLLGGTHWGDGTVCDPNPCPSGACCFNDGHCEVLMPDACVEQGGIYQGDGISCDPNPCPSGACCVDDGGCLTRTEQECANIGGDFQGNGTTCAPNPCPPIVVKPDGTGDYPTIQEAIWAAEPGAIVELANGIYQGPLNRDLGFGGKPLTLRSQSGNPDSCIIDCEGSSENEHRGFTFGQNDGPDAVLQGISIVNGYAEEEDIDRHWGGGIYSVRASPTIMNCVFSNCYAAYRGGGMYVDRGCPTLIDCVFLQSSAEWGGGGLYVYRADGVMTLQGCRFEGNQSNHEGGGLSFTTNASVISDRCVFYGNGGSGGIQAFNGEVINCTFVANVHGIWGHGTQPRVYRSIFAFNEGLAIHCVGQIGTMECSNVFGNGMGDWVECLEGMEGESGNFSADPLFCDWENGNFALNSQSPCLPGSSPCGELVGALGVGCPSSSLPEDTLSVAPPVFLSGPKPNPSTGRVVLDMNLAHAERVRVWVYDVRGRLVERLFERVLDSGQHSIVWEPPGWGSGLGSGVYYVRVKSGSMDLSRSVIVVR
jgi:hypothetical protein